MRTSGGGQSHYVPRVEQLDNCDKLNQTRPNAISTLEPCRLRLFRSSTTISGQRYRYRTTGGRLVGVIGSHVRRSPTEEGRVQPFQISKLLEYQALE